MRSYTITYNEKEVIKIMSIDKAHAKAKLKTIYPDAKIKSTVLTKNNVTTLSTVSNS